MLGAVVDACWGTLDEIENQASPESHAVEGALETRMIKNPPVFKHLLNSCPANLAAVSPQPKLSYAGDGMPLQFPYLAVSHCLDWSHVDDTSAPPLYARAYSLVSLHSGHP